MSAASQLARKKTISLGKMAPSTHCGTQPSARAISAQLSIPSAVVLVFLLTSSTSGMRLDPLPRRVETGPWRRRPGATVGSVDPAAEGAFDIGEDGLGCAGTGGKL